MDTVEYGETVNKIMSSGADVVFNTIVPPGVVPFFQQLHDAGFRKRGGQIVCTYFDENLSGPVAAGARGRPLRLPRLLSKRRRSVLPEAARANTTRDFPARSSSPGAAPARSLPGNEALGSGREGGRHPRQGKVIEALDHAKIAEGPGGPAEMVPGQHHVRMNMYIAQAKSGRFEIVKSLGAIDPRGGDRVKRRGVRGEGLYRLTLPVRRRLTSRWRPTGSRRQAGSQAPVCRLEWLCQQPRRTG